MSEFNFDPYTHITPSRRMGILSGEEVWYTLFNLTNCDCCGGEAVEHESPHIRSATFFLEAINAGMIVTHHMPDQLGWCDDFGGSVCFECEA